MKRSLLGALLFLVLVGEPTVGRTSGLFSPLGIVTFALLYMSYFLFFDSIVYRYTLNNLQLVLVNFIFYSVLITGLLHGELRDYVLHPHNDVITTLIRIQSSCFPLYAYPLLRILAPGTKPLLKLSTSAWVFIGAMLLLSLSRHIGIVYLLNTIQVAPGVVILAGALAAAALFAALWQARISASSYQKRRLVLLWSWAFLSLV